MKILFVGNYDSLAAVIMERLRKEENDIYLLTSNVDKLGRKVKSTYRCYEIGVGEGMADVYHSVRPDVVIYAGTDQQKEQWSAEQSECFALLANNLEGAVRANVGRFLFLSTIEVYGTPKQTADESTAARPVTRKGLWMYQAEEMVETYSKNHGLATAILRLGQVFCGDIFMESGDCLARIKEMIEQEETILNDNLHPIHVNDVTEAIVRLIQNEAVGIYNVCGSKAVQRGEVARLIVKSEEMVQEPKIQEAECRINVGNHKLKKATGWKDVWSVEEFLTQGKIKFTSTQKVDITKKFRLGLGGKTRSFLENIILLAVFAALFFLTGTTVAFAKWAWMLLYVVVVGLLYGVKYSLPAAVLATVVQILGESAGTPDLSDWGTWVHYVLQLAQYLFVGMVVGYTVDVLREENRIKKQEVLSAQEAYKRLADINEQNILIKNEYEKRILSAKNSIPQLYSIIQKIDVLESDRIFMEVLHVIEELMGTNTVAVYRANRRYLRLITALNEESLLEKRSIDLEKYPYLKKAMTNNELYEGNVWKKEPALVLPITIEEECEAIIIINEVPMENMSLYHINMLRTLLLLISRSLKSAFQYDEAVREDKYVRNTDILFPGEFAKALKLAKEKQERDLGGFSILKIVPKENMTEEYHKLENYFRSEDIWGMDWKKNVYVLLANTSEKEAEIALERLRKRNVDVTVVNDVDLGE